MEPTRCQVIATQSVCPYLCVSLSQPLSFCELVCLSQSLSLCFCLCLSQISHRRSHTCKNISIIIRLSINSFSFLSSQFVHFCETNHPSTPTSELSYKEYTAYS